VINIGLTANSPAYAFCVDSTIKNSKAFRNTFLIWVSVALRLNESEQIDLFATPHCLLLVWLGEFHRGFAVGEKGKLPYFFQGSLLSPS
jgi:hypothetical protein